MNVLTKWLVIILLGLKSLVAQSMPSSPCPTIFAYDKEESRAGRWYGKVLLSTDTTLHGLWLNIILDESAEKLGNWIGNVTTYDNKDFKIENTSTKILPGPPLQIKFFVDYNQRYQPPYLSAIRLNGREICSVKNAVPVVVQTVPSYDNTYTRPNTENSYSKPNTDNTYSRPTSDNTYNPDYNSPAQRPEYNPTYKPENSYDQNGFTSASVYRPVNNGNNHEVGLTASGISNSYNKPVKTETVYGSEITYVVSTEKTRYPTYETRPIHQNNGYSDETRPSSQSNGFSENTRPEYNDNSRPSGQNTGNSDSYRPNTQITGSSGNRRPESDNYSGMNSRPSTGVPVVDESVLLDVFGPSTETNRRPVYGHSEANPNSIIGMRPNVQNVGVQTRPAGSSSFNRRTTTTTPSYETYGGNTGGNTGYDATGSFNSEEDEGSYFEGDFHSNVQGSNRPKQTTTKKPMDNEQCGKVRVNAAPLVVHGKQTLPGQWPWHIAIYQTQTVDNKYICGGTLISHNVVVTAAHCVTHKMSKKIVNPGTLTVYLGKHNLRLSSTGVQIKLVSKIKVHPQYNGSYYYHDVALLKLTTVAELTDYVRPACLWPDQLTDLGNVVGVKGSVVGWGFDENGAVTEELTLAEMPVVDQQTCLRSFSEFFAKFTSDYTYCAGFLNGTSVCNGDSGGGMVFPVEGSWYLRGLVSVSVSLQNESRCDPSYYVVFTDLAKFSSWLKRTISELDRTR